MDGRQQGDDRSGQPLYQDGWANNPDFMPGDSNPYGLATAPGVAYMVDGGSNTLTWVPRRGTPRVIAAFPNPGPFPDPDPQHTFDAVPTCVTPVGGHDDVDDERDDQSLDRGRPGPRNNKVVVADLNGRIFVVDGSSITVAAASVTRVDGAFFAGAGGCVADGKGNVYITDIFAGGLVKPNLASMELSWVRPPGTFNFPTGVTIGKGGRLYVANNGVCPESPTPVAPLPDVNPCAGVTGELVRLNP